MRALGGYFVRLTAKKTLRLAWRAAVLLLVSMFLVRVTLHAQCPDTGETKVFQSKQGTGYYFYRFLGDSSFRYFLNGKKFSFNDKDDPGKTFVFLDDFAFEPLLVERAYVAKYEQSSKDIDILRAQAKHQQEYFKKAVPSIVVTDYGPSESKTPDGSDGRVFYLWKKESPAGSKAATQYLVSTVIKAGVVVLSVMRTKGTENEDEAFQ